MALRVLLADESSTIKKVIQLALQDFSVDVKTVHLGIDVLEVARQYKPQIIFADVLLQKKNGYEVCYEIKSDPSTQQIPVILMWSSFMAVDHNRIAEVRSDGQLEKPFDVDDLRALVMKLVPELRESPVANYLNFGASTTATFQDEEKQRSREFKKTSQRPLSPAHQAAAELASYPPPQPARFSETTRSNEIPEDRVNSGSLESGLNPSESSKELRSWTMEDFEDLGNFADNAEVSLSMDHPAVTPHSTSHMSSVPQELPLESFQNPTPEATPDFDFNDFKFSTDDLHSEQDEPPLSPLKSQNLMNQKSSPSNDNSDSFFSPVENSQRSTLDDFRIDLNDDSEEDFILADISQDRPISRPEARSETRSETRPDARYEARPDARPDARYDSPSSFNRPMDNVKSADEGSFQSFDTLPSLNEFKEFINPKTPAPLETQDDLSILISRHVERALREHLPKIIEESVRKLLPGVATSIITREIEKVAEELSKLS